MDIPGFIDNFFSLEQYRQVLFHNVTFWAAWWNTLILVVPVMLLSTVIAALEAKASNVGLWRICPLFHAAAANAFGAQLYRYV